MPDETFALGVIGNGHVVKRKLLGFAAGIVTAFVGFYLTLFGVLSIWGLYLDRWATFTMVALPIGLAVAACAWVIRRDRALLLPALGVGLVCGFLVALVADLFVDGFELGIVGAALVLGIEAWVVDPPSESRSPVVDDAETA